MREHRAILDAVKAGDADKAAADHKVLVKTIDKAIKVGAIHANNGARKKSRAERALRAGAAS